MSNQVALFLYYENNSINGRQKNCKNRFEKFKNVETDLKHLYIMSRIRNSKYQITNTTSIRIVLQSKSFVIIICCFLAFK